MVIYFRVISVLIALACSTLVFAKSEISNSTVAKKNSAALSPFCKKINLPDFKISDSLPALKIKFDSHTHLQLTQYLWFIVLSKKPSKLAVPLFQYLSNSQATDKTSGYYGALALAVGIKQPLYEEVKTWPHVTEPQSVKTNLNELCDRYFSATEGKVNE